MLSKDERLGILHSAAFKGHDTAAEGVTVDLGSCFEVIRMGGTRGLPTELSKAGKYGLVVHNPGGRFDGSDQVTFWFDGATGDFSSAGWRETNAHGQPLEDPAHALGDIGMRQETNPANEAAADQFLLAIREGRLPPCFRPKSPGA